jgi:hypothetical protein
MSMAQLVEGELESKTEVLVENLPPRHFAQHKPYIT